VTNIKLKTKNILLIKIRLKKTMYRLKIKNGLKIILRNINIFLVFI